MRRLRVLWGALLVSAVAGGTLLLANRHQAEGTSPAALHAPDRRCRGGCLSPLLRVLPGGPLASQVGTGALQDTWGRTVTGTRASSKTCCTNASCSTLVTLSNNQPCVDTVGLNAEGSATNLMLSSGAVGSGVGGSNTPWAWGGTGGASASLNQAVAPDGTSTASTITLSGASAGSKLIYQNYTVSASTTYTCSVWLWTASGTYQLRLGRTNQASWATATVSPTLTLTTTPTRYSLTYTSAVGETGSAFTIGSENKTPFLAADGSFYAWGAQCEAGSSPTSYIATTGTTATRAADQINWPTVALNNTAGAVKACITPAWPTGNTPSGVGGTFIGGNGAQPSLLYTNQSDSQVDSYDGTTAVTIAANWTQGTKRCYRNAWGPGSRTVYNLTDGTSSTTAAGWLGVFSSPTLVATASGPFGYWLTDVCMSAQTTGCP